VAHAQIAGPRKKHELPGFRLSRSLDEIHYVGRSRFVKRDFELLERDFKKRCDIQLLPKTSPSK
jgi:hypothetical protein